MEDDLWWKTTFDRCFTIIWTRHKFWNDIGGTTCEEKNLKEEKLRRRKLKKEDKEKRKRKGGKTEKKF